ncbi:hypothetical protein KC19_VG240400 [Ceratodon purpureus]|uniref:Uncharacterized protein n=1 Tax=Ceratodon purpureus TaxID=3225 RepID=A0A8T0HTT1_CERPU|nr:hypothetical protein KC19_VG240400 [Ceratodon purpureus]
MESFTAHLADLCIVSRSTAEAHVETDSIFWSIPRDDVERNDKDWFYHPVYCQNKCGASVGVVNKYRFLSFFPSGCPKCGNSTQIYRASDMAEEPVTLHCVMYGITYKVTYPNRKRVEDLMAEFATLCKGKVKPNRVRKYFVSIHCGKEDFSNKMMLNRHRYVEGCKAVKHPDGTQALLLPYPDFIRGEGKRVEVLGKTTAATKAKSAAATTGSMKGGAVDVKSKSQK